MKLRCFIGAILFLALTACLRPDSDPNLSNGDLTYCCLYLLGLSDADVSALMQKEYAKAMDFNVQWIENLKAQNAYIYDIGTPNGSPVSSPFYIWNRQERWII
jgi:hypothetical protein